MKYVVRNEDSGEVVATYATFQEALDHVIRFPADYIDQTKTRVKTND